jgi:hypothetical protein
MPYFEKKRWRDITPAMVEKWITQARAETKPDGSRRYAEKTLRNYTSSLQIIMDEAARLGIITASPFAEKGAVRLPRKTPQAKRDALTVPESGTAAGSPGTPCLFY